MIKFIIPAVSLSAALAGAQVSVRSVPSPANAAPYAITPAPLSAPAPVISPLAASKLTLTPSIAAPAAPSPAAAARAVFQTAAARFSAPASLARDRQADVRGISSSLFDGQTPGDDFAEAGTDASVLGNERGSVFGRRTGEGLIHSVWARYRNRRSDVSRSVFGVGGPWTMHRSLARKLVDENSLFSLPLFSGMQTPVFDAVEYLAEIKDAASIDRIRSLFEARSGPPSMGRKGGSGPGYSVSFSYGPMDYLPSMLQGAAAKALLALMPNETARQFTTDALSQAEEGRSTIGRGAMKELSGFAVRNSMSELAPLLLALSKKLELRFQGALRRYETAGMLSYDDLYGYEDLAQAVYRLGIEPQKSEALRMLVDEYNHPDSGTDPLAGGRTHDHIWTIMLDIVNQDLASAPAERARLIARLKRDRFEYDSQRYRPR